MAYRFYDKEALLKEKNEKLKYRFGLSGKTYDELIMDPNTNNDLLFMLLTQSNRFDVIEDIENDYDYGCVIYDNTDSDILSALYYDREYHPDEVIFVTTNKDKAKMANLYFGEDSIYVIK